MLSGFAKLPVVTLNIERSFVVDEYFAAGGLTRLSGSINLAHALKLNVVAEGAATDEHMRPVRLTHCYEMRGSLFGRQVTAEIFEERYQ
jgi:EAL domain-containing protein (putative c-di-GMP-specific phosphodiesterase class I)